MTVMVVHGCSIVFQAIIWFVDHVASILARVYLLATQDYCSKAIVDKVIAADAPRWLDVSCTYTCCSDARIALLSQSVVGIT